MVEKNAVVTVFGIKNCDTMKKALRWLDEQGVAYEFVDYKKAGVVAERLPDWMQRADWKVLLNTRGLMWKKLSEAERTDVDADKAAQLMQTYPAMIKRPVLDTGAALEVGFDPARYAALFGC
jgi:arsenate reductase